MNDLEQQTLDFINHDYSHTTFHTRLYDLFCKEDEFIKAYIKVGRKFWHYDGEKMCYRKLKVTYVRSGVMFFVYEDDPEVEYAWYIGSFNCDFMYAAQIYPYEIGNLLSKYYENADKDFPKICKQCKWEDCDGRITVEVIWDKEE